MEKPIFDFPTEINAKGELDQMRARDLVRYSRILGVGREIHFTSPFSRVSECIGAVLSLPNSPNSGSEEENVKDSLVIMTDGKIQIRRRRDANVAREDEAMSPIEIDQLNFWLPDKHKRWQRWLGFLPPRENNAVQKFLKHGDSGEEIILPTAGNRDLFQRSLQAVQDQIASSMEAKATSN